MTTEKTVKTLLDSASIQQCEKLAEKADLQGKRAKALLALNNGDNNSVAAEKSGLTAGQVSYMFNRFKKIGMELFNASSVKKAVVKKAATKKSVTKKATAKKAAASKPATKKTEPAPVSDSTETTDSTDTTDTNKEESDSDSKKSEDKKKKGKDKKGKKSKKESKKDKKGKKKSKKDKK